MPFVRIHCSPRHSAALKETISRSIHESLMEAFSIPSDDYFQVFHEVPDTDRRHPSTYLGVTYGNDVLFIEIVARGGRSPEQKKKLYALIAGKITDRTPLQPGDVFIVLVENTVECWSFGNGAAQYL